MTASRSTAISTASTARLPHQAFHTPTASSTTPMKSTAPTGPTTSSRNSNATTATSSNSTCPNSSTRRTTTASAAEWCATTAPPSPECSARTSPTCGWPAPTATAHGYATRVTDHRPISSTSTPRSTSLNANPSDRPTSLYPAWCRTAPRVRAIPTPPC